MINILEVNFFLYLYFFFYSHLFFFVDILSTDDIRRIIDSIADNEAYYAFNVRPVKKMLQLLQENFDKEKSQDPFSLSLSWRPSKIFDSINPSHLFSSSSSSYTSSTYGNSLNYSSGGAQLSHNHSTQYKFVLQSLTLWAEIMRNMPMLWINADCDMILESYRLVNTGQGLHRLQSCPRVAKKMRSILTHVQVSIKNYLLFFFNSYFFLYYYSQSLIHGLV